jgi:hypothetical protein
MQNRQRELYDIVLAFLDAFMSFFTDNTVYAELHGRVNESAAV